MVTEPTLSQNAQLVSNAVTISPVTKVIVVPRNIVLRSLRIFGCGLELCWESVVSASVVFAFIKC